MAWPGRGEQPTRRQLAGDQFSEPWAVEIKVGAMRLVNVRSQCVGPILTAHITQYDFSHVYLGSAPPSARALVLPAPRAQCRLPQPQTSVAAKASAPPSPTSPKPQAADKARR